MSRYDSIGTWIARGFAIFLAIVALALIIPNIGPPQGGGGHSLSNTITNERSLVAVLVYVLAAVLPVGFIFVGHKRWQFLEYIGWFLLVVLVILALLK